MYTEEDYNFQIKVEKTIDAYGKTGYGCGCLTGIIFMAALVTYLLTPSVNLEELGKKWQQENSTQPQKVKPAKKKFVPIIRSNQRY